MIKKTLALALVILMMSSAVISAFAAEAELPFADVKKKAWFYDAVRYVYDGGIMNGTSATKFDPSGEVTRAMFVTMLGRLHGAAEATSTSFTDVSFKKGAWYAGYVGWASENGIVTGYEDNTFRPNDSLTREQMSAIISRYISYSGILPLKNPDASGFFTDEKRISSWAKADVDNMRVLGLVEGKDGGRFDPKGKLTRAQAATIIQRLDEMLKYLELDEPITPDYTVEGEDFVLMGAYDLYYAGTAFGCSVGGLKVAAGDIPYVTPSTDKADADAFKGGGERPPTESEQFRRDAERNTLFKGTDLTAYELDINIACVDPEKYPVVRFAYRSASEVTFGVYANDCTSELITMETGADAAGFTYGIADISGSSAWSKSSEEISLTLMSTESIDVLYFAAFADKKSAEAFDITKYKSQVSSYDGEIIKIEEGDASAAYEEALAVADAILSTGNNYTEADVKGESYYVSSLNGDDSNDGLTPETALATFANLYKYVAGGTIRLSTVTEGDAVFVERGSYFNNKVGKDNFIDIYPGVLYTTYGEGEKPLITCELPMDEPAGKWSATEWENIWRLDYDIVDNPGNISFVKPDGTELWGIMVFPKNYADPFKDKTRSYGLVSNGEEHFFSGGVEFKSPGDLKNNLEYYGDCVEGGLYLYYDKGNPGEEFSEIHISLSGGGVGYEDTKASTILSRFDNFAIKYVGGCGIGSGGADNLAITNCFFEWIGGAYQGDDVRYGNAIQNWGSCDGMYVNDCYFKDIYDAAISTQGSSGVMNNFYSSGCVLLRCDLSYEFFNHGDTTYFEDPCLCNLIISDNYVLDAGFGYCDVRTDRRGAFLYTTYGTNNTTRYENIIYENNVNVCTSEYAIYSAELALGKSEGTILRNNVYYMDTEEAYYGKLIQNLIDRTGVTRILYPYSSRYLTYLASIGIEEGSTFYYTTNPDRAGAR